MAQTGSKWLKMRQNGQSCVKIQPKIVKIESPLVDIVEPVWRFSCAFLAVRAFLTHFGALLGTFGPHSFYDPL